MKPKVKADLVLSIRRSPQGERGLKPLYLVLGIADLRRSPQGERGLKREGLR